MHVQGAKMYRLKFNSPRQTNRELTHVKSNHLWEGVQHFNFYETRGGDKAYHINFGVKPLCESKVGTKFASHPKSSWTYLNDTLTSISSSRNHLLECHRSPRGSTSRRSISLRLFSTIGHPIRCRCPKIHPHSQWWLPFLHQGSKACLAHPLSCVFALAQWRHPGASQRSV